MMRMMARIAWPRQVLFVTLTVPQLESPRRVKAALHHLLTVVRQRYPRAWFVWRFEMESSGSRIYHPHVHLIVGGVSYIPIEWLCARWSSALGQEVSNGVDIKRAYGVKKIRSYLSKYLYKNKADDRIEALRGLAGALLPWLSMGLFSGTYVQILLLLSFLSFPGRIWGVGGPIPWALTCEALMPGSWAKWRRILAEWSAIIKREIPFWVRSFAVFGGSRYADFVKILLE